MEKLNYWQKQTDKKLFQDLEWNIPEQKTGNIALIGGNSGSFSTIIRAAETLENLPVKSVSILLPDNLKSKLPPLENIDFLPSNATSFIKSDALNAKIAAADFSVFLGDFSKNSETAVAIASAVKSTAQAAQATAQSATKPILLTRDTIDLLLPEMPEIISQENLFFVGSMAQLQKLFRAVYYPKVLLLSMPLLPAVEALHKFTLSYPCTILTFHEGQIIVASSGKIITTPIEKTSYTPLSLWSGSLAVKIAANNLFSPQKPLEATVFSI